MYMNYRHNNCGCMKIMSANNCGCHKGNFGNTNGLIEDTCDEASKIAEIAEKIYNNSSQDGQCSCGYDERDGNGLPECPVLAQAYVPIQKIDKTFCPDVGLRMGTLYPELVRPYMPNQSMMVNNFIADANEIGEGCNNVM